MRFVPAFALIALSTLPSLAFAQVTDLDGESGKSKSGARETQSKAVREVVKGTYIKANMGSTLFIGTFGGVLSPVMGSSLGVGSEFVDGERFSAAWEVDLAQSLQNGPKLDVISGLAPNQYIQGDIHTLTALAAVEFSGYVTRRFGVGGRVGGGVMMVPLLMEQVAFDEQVVVGSWGLASGTTPKVHSGPLPTIVGGPTIEYYTKLSHFSIGADIDVYYAIGFDLALSPSGYLKYTF